jgi:CDP-diacylglycerol--serine O-phosphatidyltransferase
VVIALLGAALFTAPWETLSVAALLYLATIPFSIFSYQRIKRRRAGGIQPAPAVSAGAPPA